MVKWTSVKEVILYGDRDDAWYSMYNSINEKAKSVFAGKNHTAPILIDLSIEYRSGDAWGWQSVFVSIYVI